MRAGAEAGTGEGAWAHGLHGDEGVVQVRPPLGASELDLLSGLAGEGAVLRVWPGQPRSRSPWLPCDRGCCLRLRPGMRSGQRADAVAWMRFLLRSVLNPTSRTALARAAVFGLVGGYRLTGRSAVGDLEVVVQRGRVRETSH